MALASGVLERELQGSQGTPWDRHVVADSDDAAASESAETQASPEATVEGGKGRSSAVIIGLIDQFCKEHLNEEYAVLCRKLAEKLGRKRPSPLLHRSPNAWASGIVRAVGGVNFLHDKSQTPYMRSTDIDHYSGPARVRGGETGGDSKDVRRCTSLTRTGPCRAVWIDNPMVWMLEVNGFMMDIRHAPREAQEIAFQKG